MKESSKPEKILLMLDLQVDPGKLGEELLARFPGARVSVLLDSCASRSVVDRYRDREIIRYSMAISLFAKIRLLKDLRSRRFDRVFFVGRNYDLRQVGAAWFTGAGEKIYIRLGASGERRKESAICLTGLLGAAFFRMVLFAFSLPGFLLLRLVFAWEKFGKRRKKNKGPSYPALPDNRAVSVVIPNYNGRELLEECLSSVVKAVSRYGRGSEIILIDDGSADESVEFVRETFPSVKVVPLTENVGFGRASHRGIEEASNELVALLNSDIAVTESFLSPLVEAFQDPDLFAVQPRAYYPDGKRLNFGLNMGRLDPTTGYIRIWNEADTEEEKRVDCLFPTLYCLGGAMLFDRRKYFELGGFDELFYPFRWEDIDICYRAGKRGWKVLYQPESVVFHKHHATLKKVFSSDYLNIIEQKNELLFAWKNLHDPIMIEEHVRRLPFYTLSQLISGRYNFFKAFLRAIRSLPGCLSRRAGERCESVKDDKNVLSKSLRLYKNFLKGDRNLGRDRRRQILILNPVFPYPPVDGGKMRVYNLLVEAARTNDVHLLCFIEESQKPDLPRMKEICRYVDTVDFPQPPGYLGKIPEALFPMYYRAFYADRMRDKLIDILKTRQIDVVQMEFDKMLYWVRFVEDTPTVYVEHDVASLFLRGGKNPPLAGWKKVFDLLEWFRAIRWEVVMGRRYSKIAVLSPQDEAVVKTFLPGADIRSVKHGTNVKEFYRGYEEIPDNSLIYVGSFRHYPNVEAIDYFIKDIWPLIKREVPDATLTIVGSYPSAEIRKFGEDPAVEVTGFVESVRPYLDRAAVFIAPMRKGFGMKGKILEAMVRGKPVVTTSIGVRGAEVVPGEHLLKGDSPREFAAAVTSLLNDKTYRKEIARAGQKLVVEEYDWSKAAEQMDVIYGELLA